MAKASIVFEEVEIIAGKPSLMISIKQECPDGSPSLATAILSLKIIMRDMEKVGKAMGIDFSSAVVQLNDDITVEDGKLVRRKPKQD